MHKEIKNTFSNIDYHEIIECIMCALDARDRYTSGHSQRVSDMAIKVCTLMSISEDECQKIHIAAHLHDIGKIGIPDAILFKQGKLTESEFNEIKKHPQIGADILSKSHYLQEVMEIVLHHHERFDGKGYPYGLSGHDIPLGSRIIAVTDSIDAMASTRCYRASHGLEYCYNQIKEFSGKMYDPLIVDFVLDHWDELKEFYGTLQ